MKNTRGTRQQFRYRVRRLIAKLDPEAVIRKREKARKDAVGVHTFEGEDGINCINVFAPAEDIALGWAAIQARANELRAAGDTRSIHELRAAAVIDLLVHRADGTARVTAQIQVIVPVGTLLGISDEDGHLPGHGDIPAEVARDLAEHADDVQRSLVDPETGALLDVTARKYRLRPKKRRRVIKPGERGAGGGGDGTQRGERPGTDPCRIGPDSAIVAANTCAMHVGANHDNAERMPGPGRARLVFRCRPRTGAVLGVRIPGLGPLPADVVETIVNDPDWQRLLTDSETSERQRWACLTRSPIDTERLRSAVLAEA
jgi:hypothetical protein